MSKAKGQKIVVKFNKSLLGEVTGNQSAFTITGQQKNPLHTGTPELTEYTVDSVERYPVATLYEDDFAGALDGVEVGGNGVVLEGEDANTNSLNFDGNDYVEVPHSQAYNLTDAITLELWVKFTTLLSPIIISKRNNSSYSWEFGLAAGRLMARINANTNMAQGNTVLQTGVWYHLAMTYNKSSIRIYINGVGEAAFYYSGAITTNTVPVAIGRRSFVGVEEYTNGIIDDVRIWNTARTQQEIQDNMDTELIGNETGLAGYWKFNEGTGTTAIDSTGVNNGTINGAIYSTTLPFTGSGYPSSATYTTTTPADTLPTNPRLKWTEDLPTGTSITAEYAVNQDALTTPITWTPINNNDLLTIPNPATGYFLWLRFTLATTDTAVTPTLLSVWLEEAEAPPDTIILNFDTYNRFNDVEGDITVAYDQSIGTLAGDSAVASFSVPFTPLDLLKTPIDEHTISVGITDVAVNLLPVTYVDTHTDHTVSVGVTEVTVELIHVDDINP